MTDTLALEKLYADVSARFVAEGPSVAQLFGWRDAAKQIPSGARIVWVPGAPGGNAGKDMPARNPGRNPRPIATLRESFYVLISAQDPTAPEDEAKQYKAARLLYDAWRRAVHKVAYGTYAIESIRWIVDKLTRRHGAALEVVCTIEAMVPDTAQATAPEDVGAELTLLLGASDEDTGDIDDGGGDIDTGEGGSAPTGVRYTADEPISALRVVRSSGAGHVVLARPPEAEANAPIGIATVSALGGEEISIATGGTLQDNAWNWTPGLPVLMGTNGILTQTQPPGQGVLVAVGTAIETDTIVVRVEPPIFTLD